LTERKIAGRNEKAQERCNESQPGIPRILFPRTGWIRNSALAAFLVALDVPGEGKKSQPACQVSECGTLPPSRAQERNDLKATKVINPNYLWIEMSAIIKKLLSEQKLAIVQIRAL